MSARSAVVAVSPVAQAHPSRAGEWVLERVDDARDFWHHEPGF